MAEAGVMCDHGTRKAFTLLLQRLADGNVMRATPWKKVSALVCIELELTVFVKVCPHP